MTTDHTLTYDELTETPPEGWNVSKHQSHADTGIVLVWGPKGSIIDGLVLHPDKRLNYVTDDEGRITSYNTGPDQTPQTTNPAKPAEASPVGTTPQPQAPSEHPTPEPQRDSTEGEVDGHDASHKDPERQVDTSEFPQETGGGWYELSDGSKVQGQEAAEKAQAELTAATTTG